MCIRCVRMCGKGVEKEKKVLYAVGGLIVACSLFPVAIVRAAETAISASVGCAYFSVPVIAGEMNDPGAVAKVQYFLKTYEDAALSVSGVYDANTITAVRAFQMKYAADILEPWGLDTPTGDVSVTTLHTMNEIHCGTTAGLSSVELRAMETVRTKYGIIEATTSDHGATSSVGIIERLDDDVDSGRLFGTPIGFMHVFSLPILIVLFFLLLTQVYFMWGIAPHRRSALIPHEFE